LGLRLYLESAGDFLSRAEYRSLGRKAASVMYSESVSVVIRKDLEADADLPEAKRKPPIRRASSADVLELVGTDGHAGTDAEDLWERRLRQHIAATIGVDRCYVADEIGIGPAFMQYLFSAEDNDLLQENFPRRFPVLAADEAMVEFLYVAPASRNLGLAVNGLLQVADEARRLGASSVLSFISPTNKGALFVNHLAGFRAVSVRRSKRRFSRRSFSFEPWPTDTSQSLSDVASGRAKIS
jgi:GNAT superfamily N-acetyltransferase